MILRSALGIGIVLAVTSCTPPAPVATTTAAHAVDPTVAAAQQLVARMAQMPAGSMASAPANMPLTTAPATDAAPPFLGPSLASDDALRAQDCLTAAIYYEARSEPVDGQRAVAQVVLNRVRDRAFPASVCGVVYQGSQRRTGCQFSFTCDGSMLARRDERAWDRSRLVAAAALAGDVYAPVGSATFYHTTAILPWWAPSLARIGVVGSHIFYRWQNALERSLAFRQRYSGSEPGVAAATQPLVAATAEVDDPAAANDLVYRVTREGQVTVHRAIAMALAPATEPVKTAAEAPAPARRAPPAAMAGVRIHRNAETPIVADET